jgi:hypothetical protein
MSFRTGTIAASANDFQTREGSSALLPFESNVDYSKLKLKKTDFSSFNPYYTVLTQKSEVLFSFKFF